MKDWKKQQKNTAIKSKVEEADILGGGGGSGGGEGKTKMDGDELGVFGDVFVDFYDVVNAANIVVDGDFPGAVFVFGGRGPRRQHGRRTTARSRDRENASYPPSSTGVQGLIRPRTPGGGVIASVGRCTEAMNQALCKSRGVVCGWWRKQRTSFCSKWHSQKRAVWPACTFGT